ncbi:MAG TPA: hypothetical protein VHH15_00670 [Actinophytocola sp.]|nr:hypothetical protein [Actinophytocola sp.]
MLCHGVLMYLPEPAPMVESLIACATEDGIVSVMALNAATLAVRPALEHPYRGLSRVFHLVGGR